MNRFKWFLLVEAALLLLLIFQLIQNMDLLVVILVGAVLIKLSGRKTNRSSVLYWIGWFLIGLGVLSTFTIWVMLTIALFYLIINSGSILESLQIGSIIDMPWKRKEYYGVETTEPVDHAGERRKQKWLGNEHIGENVYEWNDINISIFMGDSIIDLGNTLLPDEENVILIRKGIGQTKVIVPMGVGVSIQHSVLQGNVNFDLENYRLSNETITLYSDDFDTATRKIKIISNTLLGDFEVIYL